MISKKFINENIKSLEDLELAIMEDFENEESIYNSNINRVMENLILKKGYVKNEFIKEFAELEISNAYIEGHGEGMLDVISLLKKSSAI